MGLRSPEAWAVGIFVDTPISAFVEEVLAIHECSWRQGKDYVKPRPKVEGERASEGELASGLLE